MKVFFLKLNEEYYFEGFLDFCMFLIWEWIYISIERKNKCRTNFFIIINKYFQMKIICCASQINYIRENIINFTITKTSITNILIRYFRNYRFLEYFNNRNMVYLLNNNFNYKSIRNTLHLVTLTNTILKLCTVIYKFMQNILHSAIFYEN